MDNHLSSDPYLSSEKKKELRALFRTLRHHISPERKVEASRKACEFLIKKLSEFPFVCSFASKKEEIDLIALNEHLASEGRLLLPKINGETLEVFLLQDLANDLEEGPFSLMQPKAACQLFQEFIPCILVPGLAFDAKKNRLGFGRGYYDRFLEKYRKSHCLGIGFEEQLAKGSLPVQSHDQKVDQIYLF